MSGYRILNPPQADVNWAGQSAQIRADFKFQLSRLAEARVQKEMDVDAPDTFLRISDALAAWYQRAQAQPETVLSADEKRAWKELYVSMTQGLRAILGCPEPRDYQSTILTSPDQDILPESTQAVLSQRFIRPLIQSGNTLFTPQNFAFVTGPAKTGKTAVVQEAARDANARLMEYYRKSYGQVPNDISRAVRLYVGDCEALRAGGSATVAQIALRIRSWLTCAQLDSQARSGGSDRYTEYSVLTLDRLDRLFMSNELVEAYGIESTSPEFLAFGQQAATRSTGVQPDVRVNYASILGILNSYQPVPAGAPMGASGDTKGTSPPSPPKAGGHGAGQLRHGGASIVGQESHREELARVLADIFQQVPKKWPNVWVVFVTDQLWQVPTYLTNLSWLKSNEAIYVDLPGRRMRTQIVENTWDHQFTHDWASRIVIFATRVQERRRLNPDSPEGTVYFGIRNQLVGTSRDTVRVQSRLLALYLMYVDAGQRGLLGDLNRPTPELVLALQTSLLARVRFIKRHWIKIAEDSESVELVNADNMVPLRDALRLDASKNGNVDLARVLNAVYVTERKAFLPLRDDVVAATGLSAMGFCALQRSGILRDTLESFLQKYDRMDSMPTSHERVGYGANLEELFLILRRVCAVTHNRVRMAYLQELKKFVPGSEGGEWTAPTCVNTAIEYRRFTFDKIEAEANSKSPLVVGQEECKGPLLVNQIDPLVQHSFGDWTREDVKVVLGELNRWGVSPKSGYPSQVKFVLYGSPNRENMEAVRSACLLNTAPSLVPAPSFMTMPSVPIAPPSGFGNVPLTSILPSVRLGVGSTYTDPVTGRTSISSPLLAPSYNLRIDRTGGYGDDSIGLTKKSHKTKHHRGGKSKKSTDSKRRHSDRERKSKSKNRR